MSFHIQKYILYLSILAFTLNGNAQNLMDFAAKAGNEFNQGYTKVVADNTGGFSVIGYFDNKVIIDDGFVYDSLSSIAGSRDAFLMYFDRRTVSKNLFSVGGNGFEAIYDAAYDSNNDLFITGVFTDTIYLDPATNTPFTTSQGGNDIFIAKYSGNYQFSWAKIIGGPGFEEVFAIETTPNDEFFIVGFYSSTLDFNPDSGLDVRTPIYSQEVFIQKYDSSGNYLWTKTIGGRGFADVKDVHYDNGYLYMSGLYADSVDFNPDSIGVAMEYAANDDVFVLKLDSNANFEWVKTFGGNSLDAGKKVRTDNQGNVYTAGEFRNRVDFDPGPNTRFIGTSGAEDVFLQRLDANGNFVWVNRYIGYNNERAKALLFNPNDQSLLVGGTFNGSCYFSVTPILLRLTNGSSDSFLHKLNKQRMLLWFESFGEAGVDNIADMTYDAFGNLIVVGEFRDSIKWNGINGTIGFDAQGTDGFIVKYNRQIVGYSEYSLTENSDFLKAYPNPVNDVLRLDLNFEENVIIQILDLNGKLLFQNRSNNSYLEIDFPYAKGIYLLRVISSEKVISEKIIKQ